MSSKIIVKGYRVGRSVSRTGFRTLYTGMKIQTGEEVLIHVISVRPGPSLRALIRRAEQSQLLTLPSIVSAIDYGVLPDQQFYYTSAARETASAMQLLERIEDQEERQFTAVRHFIELLRSIAYIHDAGATHRDLHSENIRIQTGGDVYLDGYINARPKIELRNVIHIVHLPYMAPEQLKGHSVDIKTDIYSLGVLFFEWLVGQLPYASNYAKVEDARQGGAPAPSQFKMDVPAELESIVLKALSPRSERYSHVQEMMTDLEDFYQKRSVRMKLRDLSSAVRRMLKLRSHS
jgi:serine/threonine protein kinase